MAVALIAGCEDPNPVVPPGPGPQPVVPPTPPEPAEKKLAELIPGEWHCEAADMSADIYVDFASDGNFELYQMVGEGSYRLYRGTWSVDEDKKMLTGKYNDGEEWGSGYSVSLSEDEKSMTLESTEGAVKNSYTRTEIPAEVKENCIVVVKSAGVF